MTINDNDFIFLQYVGLGSALAMGLDAVENSLLGNQSE